MKMLNSTMYIKDIAQTILLSNLLYEIDVLFHQGNTCSTDAHATQYILQDV